MIPRLLAAAALCAVGVTWLVFFAMVAVVHVLFAQVLAALGFGAAAVLGYVVLYVGTQWMGRMLQARRRCR